jgi:hypothetical protein
MPATPSLAIPATRRTIDLGWRTPGFAHGDAVRWSASSAATEGGKSDSRPVRGTRAHSSFRLKAVMDQSGNEGAAATEGRIPGYWGPSRLRLRPAFRLRIIIMWHFDTSAGALAYGSMRGAEPPEPAQTSLSSISVGTKSRTIISPAYSWPKFADNFSPKPVS